jgi:dolichol-phosphate mannosyltransferase
MNAGRDLAVGDYIYEFDKILFDYDESLIMDAYKKALTGFDIVAVCPKKHVSVSSKLFYLLYNWANKSPNKLQQERFRVISRRAVNRINQLNSYIPYRKAMYVNCGLNRASIEYESTCKAKKGSTKLEKSSRSDLAFDSFIIFTDIMEKISFFLCALFLLVMIVMAGYVGYSVFSEVRPVEGWMSTIGLISFGFFGVFLLLTLILKYLSVILNLIFRKQRYVISGVEKLTK